MKREVKREERQAEALPVKGTVQIGESFPPNVRAFTRRKEERTCAEDVGNYSSTRWQERRGDTEGRRGSPQAEALLPEEVDSVLTGRSRRRNAGMQLERNAVKGGAQEEVRGRAAELRFKTPWMLMCMIK